MHKADNPELLKAELGLKIYSYPEFYTNNLKIKRELSSLSWKTTITSMILHVMHYHGIAVDYMVGAQLEGFDTMVHLTEENDLSFWKEMSICHHSSTEGLSFICTNLIALISELLGIISMFFLYENYVEQFEILSKNYCGGILVYNEDEVKK
jgi:UDP-N-acetylmuramate: L-alanyl-gamma-D-glutamyl-meso-diaminopimelate ligase